MFGTCLHSNKRFSGITLDDMKAIKKKYFCFHIKMITFRVFVSQNFQNLLENVIGSVYLLMLFENVNDM